MHGTLASSLPIIIGFVPPILVIVILVGAYNGLVNLRNLIRNSWSDVDTELKRRYDLIPNLVSAVKGYATHERALLEEVASARARAAGSNGEPESQARDENVLVGVMTRLMAVVERYPELKADRHFLDLQRELVNTEDRIQAARRFFNGNVRDYNNKVSMFPSVIVAKLFGFRPHAFFQIDELHRAVPDAR